MVREQPKLRPSDARRFAVERLFPDGIRRRDLPSDEEVGEQLRALIRSSQPQLWENRFAVYAKLLAPLAQVQQDSAFHPEGDVLYHSLQVFQLVENQVPYDEELLTAALLHDVGKAFDLRGHTQATLRALAGIVTPRTSWFIENLPIAQSLIRGTLGTRARNRLKIAEDFDELMILAESDTAGRKCGIAVLEIEDAIKVIQDLYGSDID